MNYQSLVLRNPCRLLLKDFRLRSSQLRVHYLSAAMLGQSINMIVFGKNILSDNIYTSPSSPSTMTMHSDPTVCGFLTELFLRKSENV